MIQPLREVDQASVHRYDELQKTELSAILESRRPRKSGGTKAILIDRLKVDDLEHPTRRFAVLVDDLEFLNVCRPSWDMEAEQRTPGRSAIYDIPQYRSESEDENDENDSEDDSDY